MDMLDLEIFAASARHGDTTRVAVALDTVQSSIAVRPWALEREPGARLFQRHSRGVALTTAKQPMLLYAGRIQALVEGMPGRGR